MRMTEHVIWEAGSREADAVAELLVEFRDWAGSSWPSDDVLARSVESLMADPNTVFLLGSSDRRSPPAGVCQLRFRFSVWTAVEDCWLEDLYVREPARRTGVGRSLLEAACEHARHRGCRRIELDVNQENDRATLLYRSMGFSPHSKGMSATGQDILMGMRL